MATKPEQFLVGGGLRSGENRQHVQLHLDPPIASANWILVRGRVQVPRVQSSRPWFLPRRKPQSALDFAGVTLDVRLPDDEEPRGLTIEPDGSFEARLVANLPRLRSAQRSVVFSLRHLGERIEQAARLFMPRPGATLGVIVLAHGQAASVIAGTRTEPTTMVGRELSECSRELCSLLSSRGAGNEPNPVFYLELSGNQRVHAGAGHERSWPEGLAIAVPARAAASAVAVDLAQWAGRITELFGNELDFVLVADTNLQNAATLRAMSRLKTCTQRLRAVFLNDTRPVACGVKLQAQRPMGIEGLELPIVLCRTLDEARRAAATCGLVSTNDGAADSAIRPARRLMAAHAHVTRHPLVFCHGMLGYSMLRFRRVDLENYFNGLRELLTDRGFRVLMPQLGRTHSIEQRAEQLRQTIGRWTSEPVNIIAHSMGGLDARFLISKLDMADRVVSLTTIASPHHGSTFADWFIERFDAKLPLLRGLEQLGLEVDGFRDCTRAASRVFNQVVPDSPKVRYFSYSAFQVARKIPPVLRRSHSLIARTEGANDGLVSELSARWGEHLATLRADHLALVGDRGPEHFDHLAFFTRIVDDLVRQGF